MLNRIAKSICVAVAAMTLAGCANFFDPIDELVDHENPLVSGSASVGAAVMGVVGVPVAIVALPVSIPVGMACDASLAPLAPMFAVAQVGAIALGGLPWLLLDRGDLPGVAAIRPHEVRSR